MEALKNYFLSVGVGILIVGLNYWRLKSKKFSLERIVCAILRSFPYMVLYLMFLIVIGVVFDDDIAAFVFYPIYGIIFFFTPLYFATALLKLFYWLKSLKKH